MYTYVYQNVLPRCVFQCPLAQVNKQDHSSFIFCVASVAFCITRFQMDWKTNKNQSATIFDIVTPEGKLTVVLARKDEAETMALYRRIESETGKTVLHIAVAAGNCSQVTYPCDATVHSCPIYHKGKVRDQAFDGLWKACKQTARERQAVLFHCNNSFHRGPVALSTIMVFSGYTKHEAFSMIAQRRHIYPGHLTSLCDWPTSEQNGSHAQDFLECHRWLEKIAAGAQDDTMAGNAYAAAASAQDDTGGGNVHAAAKLAGANHEPADAEQPPHHNRIDNLNNC